MTMGIVTVAALAGRVADGPAVTITLTLSTDEFGCQRGGDARVVPRPIATQ